jgi:hypothetical protein
MKLKFHKDRRMKRILKTITAVSMVATVASATPVAGAFIAGAMMGNVATQAHTNYVNSMQPNTYVYYDNPQVVYEDTIVHPNGMVTKQMTGASNGGAYPTAMMPATPMMSAPMPMGMPMMPTPTATVPYATIGTQAPSVNVTCGGMQPAMNHANTVTTVTTKTTYTQPQPQMPVNVITVPSYQPATVTTNSNPVVVIY